MSPQGSTCPVGNQGSVVDDGQRSVQGHQGSVDECDDGAAPPTPEPPMPMWAWFEADRGVTFDGGVPIAIDDLSGNGRHCTTSPLSSPGYVAVGINGLPSIEFFIFDDMRFENFVDNIPAGSRTVKIVAQPNNQIGGTLMSFRRTTEDWACYLYELSGTQYIWSNGLANIQRVGPAVDYSGAPRLIQHSQIGASFTCRVDGVVISPVAAAGDPNGADGFVLGNRGPGGYAQGFIGLISAWLIWDYALTPEQDAQADAYIFNKWGVPN